MYGRGDVPWPLWTSAPPERAANRTRPPNLPPHANPVARYDLGMRVEPLVVAVPDAVLDDLRERIRRTRWPDSAPGGPWAEGADLDYLRGLLEYWADGFDWRTQEQWLNRFDHREADVDGARVHFVHPRAGDGRVPLVLTHGWPSTFIELLSLIDRLGDRFDLVVPS